MEIKDLEIFGMTPVESKIYYHLATNGDGTLGEISNRTGIHRGTVYNSVNKLIEKGFIVFSKKEHTTRYYLSDTNTLIDSIKYEKEKIFQKEKKAFELVENLKNLNQNPTERPKVSIAFGGKAYLEHFMSMFNICKKNKIEYLCIGDGLGNTHKEIGEDNYMKIINTKKKMNIKFRSIMNIKAKPLKHEYYKPGDRYLPENYSLPSYIWIYGNRVVNVIFSCKPIVVITMEDSSVAESYKNYFEAMYKVAKP
jgi:sugar-specific transcriptional regulator TrmB